MALWFLRGVRRRVVTTRYPGTPPDPWTADLRTPPQFRPSLLTFELAERLVAICPSRALSRDGADLVYDVGACTACGQCLEVAGAAISPSGELELASRNRLDLVKRIPISGGRQ